MVEKLAKHYGKRICDIDGVTYHSFPSVEDLAGAETEQTLRADGFGYRSGYITKSARKILQDGGNTWLENLKKLNYNDAKEKLMTLNGVGAKVILVVLYWKANDS